MWKLLGTACGRIVIEYKLMMKGVVGQQKIVTRMTNKTSFGIVTEYNYTVGTM